MDAKQITYFIKRASVFTAAIALFTAISCLCEFVLYAMADRLSHNLSRGVAISEDLLCAMHVFLSLLAYHSFLYSAAFFDKELVNRVSQCKSSKLAAVFASREPIMTLVLTVVAFVTVPNAFSVKMLDKWLEIGVANSVLILAPAFFTLHFATWIEILFRRVKNKNFFGIRHTVKNLIGACISYPMFACLLPIFFPTFRTFPKVAWLVIVAVFPTVAVLVGISLLYPVLRAVIIRHRFVKKLKKAAKKNGYSVYYKTNLYSSIFADHDGSDFTVVANGKTYVCKLLSGMIYQNPMYFMEEGKGKIVRGVRFRMFLYGARGLGRIGWHNTDDFARFETEFTYGFEGEGKKVIIVCPTPHSIYVSGYGKNKLVDVADVIWGRTLMTGTAFLNALERDCI